MAHHTLINVSGCIKVVHKLKDSGFMADVDDDHGTTLNKKIRSAQLAQYNYIFGE